MLGKQGTKKLPLSSTEILSGGPLDEAMRVASIELFILAFKGRNAKRQVVTSRENSVGMHRITDCFQDYSEILDSQHAQDLINALKLKAKAIGIEQACEWLVGELEEKYFNRVCLDASGILDPRLAKAAQETFDASGYELSADEKAKIFKMAFAFPILQQVLMQDAEFSNGTSVDNAEAKLNAPLALVHRAAVKRYACDEVSCAEKNQRAQNQFRDKLIAFANAIDGKDEAKAKLHFQAMLKIKGENPRVYVHEVRLQHLEPAGVLAAIAGDMQNDAEHQALMGELHRQLKANPGKEKAVASDLPIEFKEALEEGDVDKLIGLLQRDATVLNQGDAKFAANDALVAALIARLSGKGEDHQVLFRLVDCLEDGAKNRVYSRVYCKELMEALEQNKPIEEIFKIIVDMDDARLEALKAPTFELAISSEQVKSHPLAILHLIAVGFVETGLDEHKLKDRKYISLFRHLPSELRDQADRLDTRDIGANPAKYGCDGLLGPMGALAVASTVPQENESISTSIEKKAKFLDKAFLEHLAKVIKELKALIRNLPPDSNKASVLSIKMQELEALQLKLLKNQKPGEEQHVQESDRQLVIAKLADIERAYAGSEQSSLSKFSRKAAKIISGMSSHAARLDRSERKSQQAERMRGLLNERDGFFTSPTDALKQQVTEPTDALKQQENETNETSIGDRLKVEQGKAVAAQSNESRNNDGVSTTSRPNLGGSGDPD